MKLPMVWVLREGKKWSLWQMGKTSWRRRPWALKDEQNQSNEGAALAMVLLQGTKSNSNWCKWNRECLRSQLKTSEGALCLDIAGSGESRAVLWVWSYLFHLLIYICFTLCWLHSQAGCLFGSEMSARISRFKSHHQPQQKANSFCQTVPKVLELRPVGSGGIGSYVCPWNSHRGCLVLLSRESCGMQMGRVFLPGNLGCRLQDAWANRC